MGVFPSRFYEAKGFDSCYPGSNSGVALGLVNLGYLYAIGTMPDPIITTVSWYEGTPGLTGTNFRSLT